MVYDESIRNNSEEQSLNASWWFTEKFTENAKKLYELLFTKDFNKDELIAQLDSGKFSVEDINLAAYKYVESCHDAETDAYQQHLFDHLHFGELLPGIESSHLVEAFQILLAYGFDPNKIMTYDDGGQTNIMEQLMFVYNGYQAADAADLILTHGGNPSLIIEDTSLIRNLNYELLFSMVGNEEFRYFSDAIAHYWMVYIGNGAKLEDGRESVDPVGNFDISNFRNHRQYYYGMIHSDRSNDGMEICFFDKDTNWEVVRY